MKSYQQQFIQFALAQNVLKFGEFTLKSGRTSPYFFNAGLFNTGGSLYGLAKFYAQMLSEVETQPFMLFGPAYKGINLSAATAIAMAENHDRDTAFAYNRKEVKAHGEGGQLVGAPLKGRVIIIDDVITAGTSVGESFPMIEQAGATVAAIAIAVDRKEKLNDDGMSAVEAIKQKYNVPVYSIIDVDDLISYIATQPNYQQHLSNIEAYRAQYGV